MSEVEAFATAFEVALRRLESFSTDDRVISTGQMEELRAEARNYDPERNTEQVEHTIPYDRAVAIVRTVLSTISTQDVGSVSEDQQQALREMYRFVTGPLLEMEVALDVESELVADTVLMKQLRRQTRDIQERITEVEILPPTDDEEDLIPS